MSHTEDQAQSIPHTIEIEQMLLGGIIKNNDAYDTIAGKLTKEDFYREDHQAIFESIVALTSASQPFDIPTLAEKLKNSSIFDSSGGLSYLSTLYRNSIGVANIETWVSILKRYSANRQVISLANELERQAYQNTDVDVLQIAEEKIFSLAEKSNKSKKSNIVTTKEMISASLERIQQLSEKGGSIIGLPTGFSELDEKTSGLLGGQLIIVAGRPSMGKSTFSFNIAENVALAGGTTLTFSMEMPSDQIINKVISSKGNVLHDHIRRGQLTESDWDKYAQVAEQLNKSKFFVDDEPALSSAEIRSRARRVKKEHGLDLIIIDYLQLMKSSGTRRNDNRTSEISEISGSLKALAREMDVPVIALSQLNRNLEQRPNKRPVNADLRESGALEQDADVIIFLYRDEVYNPDSPDKGTGEIILGKQRNGPLGTIRALWEGHYSRYRDLPNNWQSPNIT